MSIASPKPAPPALKKKHRLHDLIVRLATHYAVHMVQSMIQKQNLPPAPDDQKAWAAMPAGSIFAPPRQQ